MSDGPKHGDVVACCPHRDATTAPDDEDMNAIIGKVTSKLFIPGEDGVPVEAKWIAVCEDCARLESIPLNSAFVWNDAGDDCIAPLAPGSDPRIRHELN